MNKETIEQELFNRIKQEYNINKNNKEEILRDSAFFCDISNRVLNEGLKNYNIDINQLLNHIIDRIENL